MKGSSSAITFLYYERLANCLQLYIFLDAFQYNLMAMVPRQNTYDSTNPITLIQYTQLELQSASCFLLLPCVECSHSNANVTLLRHIPTYKNLTSVNYYIARDPPVPVSVEIYRDGERLAVFQCENGSLLDRGGTTIVEVFFKPYCEDPTVLVNHSVTINIILDLHGILSDVDRACSSVTIRPQSKYCTIFMITRISAYAIYVCKRYCHDAYVEKNETMSITLCDFLCFHQKIVFNVNCVYPFP